MSLNFFIFTIIISKRRYSLKEINRENKINNDEEKMRELRVKQASFFQYI